MSVAQRFQDIADAIREKTGETGLITPLQMPAKILGISSGVNVLTGYSVPDDSEGEDNDIYFQLLSNDFTELSYIENVNDSYIKTDYIPNLNSDVIMYCNVTGQGNGASTVFGSRSGGSGNRFYIFSELNNYRPIYSFNFNETYFDGTDWNNDIIIRLNKTMAQFGQYTASFTVSSFSSSEPIYLFTLNQSGADYGSVTHCLMKMYNCKIYEGETLLRYFIPCKRNSDDAIGALDIKSGVFYENSGSTAFNTGEEITDKRIINAYRKVNNEWTEIIGSLY